MLAMPDSTTRDSVRQLPASILNTTLFLLPALGWPNLFMVGDSFKWAILNCGVLLAALAFCWRAPAHPLRLHRLLTVPLLLLGYALASMVWSSAYLGALSAAHWLVAALLMWLVLNVYAPAQLPRLLLALHAGACVAALWAAGQFWFDWSLFAQGPPPASSFINRNFYAEYAVCVFPFSLWLLATLRSPRWLYAMALSLAFNLSTILMTGARSALLALALTLPFALALLLSQRHSMAWYRPGRLRRFLAVFLLGLLAFVNFPSASPRILAETPDATAWRRTVARSTAALHPTPDNSESIAVRAALWRAALNMLHAHPWTGVGAGAFEIHLPLFQEPDTAFELDYQVHNEYLQLLTEYGLVCGGLALAVLLAVSLRSGLRWALPARDATQCRTWPERIGAWHCLLALLALAVVSCFGFPWHMATTLGLAALTLGLLAAGDANPACSTPAPGTAPPHHAVGARHRSARWLLPPLLLLLLGTVYAVQRTARAEHSILHALFAARQLPRNAAPLSASAQARKTAMLEELRRGIALNANYRQVTPLIAKIMELQNDWQNAAWILRSVTDNHPNVFALWLELTHAYIELQEPALALDAWQHLQQLRPMAAATRSLEIVVRSISGQDTQARDLARARLEHPDPVIDYEMPQAGYALALKLHDQSLAVLALTVRNRYWPEQAGDAFFRIGLAYAQMEPHNPTLALKAFNQGLRSVPANQYENYLLQVPAPFREALKRQPAAPG